MSRPSTRKAALEQASKDHRLTMERADEELGVRDLIEAIAPRSARVAAFDTRLDAPPMFTGRASRAIARRLQRRGCRLVAEPESFLVTKQNELVPGERERARDWGQNLAEHVRVGHTV
jgi:hypothetical protein